ncbi:hypothetical protein, partial [Litoreibacter roseus]|uniref:hypothetical protein n=1 Tax=Litoreibacter roseus TaxID=2601869 RepID=UPI001A9A6ED7
MTEALQTAQRRAQQMVRKLDPEGFSMRAGVQPFLPARRAARVDKPRKEEAAVSGIRLWRKSA